MLGISSAWRSEISDSGREIVEEILNLGVQAMELEYRMTRSMLKEVDPLVKAGRIAVTSLHNILPLPKRIPKNMAPASLSLCRRRMKKNGNPPFGIPWEQWNGPKNSGREPSSFIWARRP